MPVPKIEVRVRPAVPSIQDAVHILQNPVNVGPIPPPAYQMGHLYIIATDADGTEYILRGGPGKESFFSTTHLAVKGADNLLPYTQANNKIHNDWCGIADQCLSLTLYQGADAMDKFQLAQMIGQEIEESALPYKFQNQNSNTLVYFGIRAMGLNPEYPPHSMLGQQIAIPGFGFSEKLSEAQFNVWMRKIQARRTAIQEMEQNPAQAGGAGIRLTVAQMQARDAALENYGIKPADLTPEEKRWVNKAFAKRNFTQEATALLNDFQEVGGVIADAGLFFHKPQIAKFGNGIKHTSTILKSAISLGAILSSSGPITLASLTNPLSAMFTAGTALFGLFSKPGPDMSQIILDQLHSIQQQISALHDLIEQGFQQLYENQRVMYEQMMREFKNLGALVHGEIYEFKVPVMQAFQNLENNLIHLGDVLNRRLDHLYLQRFGQLLSTLEEYTDQTPELRPAEVARQLVAHHAADNTVSQLSYWIHHEACSDTLNGRIYALGHLDRAGATRWIEQVLNSAATDVNNLTGFLAEYAKRLLSSSKAPPFEEEKANENAVAVPGGAAAPAAAPVAAPQQMPFPDDIDVKSIPNLDVWSSGARRYLEVRKFLRRAGHSYDSHFAQFQKILAVSSHFLRFVEFIQYSAGFFSQLFQSYEKILSRFGEHLSLALFLRASNGIGNSIEQDFEQNYRLRFDEAETRKMPEHTQLMLKTFNDHQTSITKNKQAALARIKAEGNILGELLLGTITPEQAANRLTNIPLTTLVTRTPVAPLYRAYDHVDGLTMSCGIYAQPGIGYLLWECPDGYSIPLDCTHILQQANIPKALILAERLGILRFEIKYRALGFAPNYLQHHTPAETGMAHRITVSLVGEFNLGRSETRELFTVEYTGHIPNDVEGQQVYAVLKTMQDKIPSFNRPFPNDSTWPSSMRHRQLTRALQLVHSIKHPLPGQQLQFNYKADPMLLIQVNQRIQGHVQSLLQQQLPLILGVAGEHANIDGVQLFQAGNADTPFLQEQFHNLSAANLLLIHYLRLAGFPGDMIETVNSELNPQRITQHLLAQLNLLAQRGGAAAQVFPDYTQNASYVAVKQRIQDLLQQNMSANKDLTKPVLVSDQEKQVRSLNHEMLELMRTANAPQLVAAAATPAPIAAGGVARRSDLVAMMQQMDALREQLAGFIAAVPPTSRDGSSGALPSREAGISGSVSSTDSLVQSFLSLSSSIATVVSSSSGALGSLSAQSSLPLPATQSHANVGSVSSTSSSAAAAASSSSTRSNIADVISRQVAAGPALGNAASQQRLLAQGLTAARPTLRVHPQTAAAPAPTSNSPRRHSSNELFNHSLYRSRAQAVAADTPAQGATPGAIGRERRAESDGLRAPSGRGQEAQAGAPAAVSHSGRGRGFLR